MRADGAVKDLEYLPRCLPCATGGRHVVYVRGYWDDAWWTPDKRPDGSIPAYRRCQAGRYVRGQVIDGQFYSSPRRESA